MKKFFILAALLMATTSAHAGGISFEIEGQRIRIEAPRNCDSLSCIRITAPGFKGFKSKRFDDDDDATYRDDRRDDRISRDDPPPAKYAPAPVQAARHSGFRSAQKNCCLPAVVLVPAQAAAAA